ncbi:MAG: peroxidase-related enzyme [Bacteroidetes bacterium]|nr:peroxidase-related enzyme [Bacteroidota bacterium]
MGWIAGIPYHLATGKLKSIYDRIAGNTSKIDNVLTIHGLRPHTLEGHVSLYKNVLHHSGNTVAPWFLESIGTYVSLLNGCAYCVAHHSQGIKRHIDNAERYAEIMKAIRTQSLELAFNEKEVAAFYYAKKLTQQPAHMEPSDISTLKKLGWEEGEILEINQVTGYFNYANRTVLGLGVSLEE